MNTPNPERATTRALDAQTPAKVLGARPARWGRLGLAAILGLVAGTVLFPSPAKGRADQHPGS